MKGYYQLRFCHLQAEINLTHHCLTSVGALEWHSIYQSTNNLSIGNVPGAAPPEYTSNIEFLDPEKNVIGCRADSS